MIVKTMTNSNHAIKSQEKLDAERISQDLLRKATTSKYRFESERYEFRDIIGRGGMGVVLNARDKLLNRDVAVKFLKPELNEIEEARNIFLSEARSMAVLSHTNLISVFDVGVVEDHVMMVVELVEGDDLFKHMHRTTPPTPMTYEEVLRIGIQLCRVVYYMHKQGMIHRDLKPANIILQKDGSIKLIDFGLTRALDDIAIRQTQVRGTPAYMSPEQQDGKELTVASDVYQIGATLFELLTTELPFKRQIQRTEEQWVLSPDRFDPSIQEELVQCLMQALQYDPAKRQQSAKALMEQLQSCYARLSQPLLTEIHQQQAHAPASDIGSLHQDPQPPTPQPQESSSKKMLYLFIASVLILGIGVGLMVSSQLKPAQLPPAQTAPVTAATTDVTPKTPPKQVTPTPKPQPAPTPSVESKPPAPPLQDAPPTTPPETKVAETKIAPTPPKTTKEAKVATPLRKRTVKRRKATKPKASQVTSAPAKATSPQPSKQIPESSKPSLFNGKPKQKVETKAKKPSLFTP